MHRGHEGTLTVASFMAPSPHCIGADQPLSLASERMAQYGVRHLPVLEGGQIVGVVSERDIALVTAVLPDVASTKVEEAMAAVPYCVEVGTPVREVARHMAARKIGSAIVTDHGKIAGVFTTTDALEVLCRLLEDFEQDAPAA